MMSRIRLSRAALSDAAELIAANQESQALHAP